MEEEIGPNTRIVVERDAPGVYVIPPILRPAPHARAENAGGGGGEELFTPGYRLTPRLAGGDRKSRGGAVPSTAPAPPAGAAAYDGDSDDEEFVHAVRRGEVVTPRDVASFVAGRSGGGREPTRQAGGGGVASPGAPLPSTWSGWKRRLTRWSARRTRSRPGSRYQRPPRPPMTLQAASCGRLRR